SLTSKFINLESTNFRDWMKEDSIIIPEAFPLSTLIDNELEELGGIVMCKLNWSSPKDAAKLFLDGQKCRSSHDVLRLIKSSDYILHDINRRYSKPLCLCLRKWYKIHKSNEFRCFVVNGKLRAMSQRHIDCYFEELFSKQEVIIDLCEQFYDDNLKGKIMDDQFLVFDVYFNTSFTKLWLIDINVFDEYTNPLLYTWDELLGEKEIEELRLVETPENCKGTTDTFNSYPLELIDLVVPIEEKDIINQLNPYLRDYNK
ncbi:hypothetical protein ROZALSC1DRAFT_30384, partial [Rozella allomycis CSF55]